MNPLSYFRGDLDQIISVLGLEVQRSESLSLPEIWVESGVAASLVTQLTVVSAFDVSTSFKTGIVLKNVMMELVVHLLKILMSNGGLHLI